MSVTLINNIYMIVLPIYNNHMLSITVLSDDAVKRMYSQAGLKETPLTSAECASTEYDGTVLDAFLVSQLRLLV